MPQRVFDCRYFLGWAWVVFVFSLLNRISGFVHIQPNHSFNLSYMGSMDFEAILLKDIFLYALIGGVFFDVSTSIFISIVCGHVYRDKRTTVSTCAVRGNISTATALWA